jgi:hypothetical protein
VIGDQLNVHASIDGLAAAAAAAAALGARQSSLLVDQIIGQIGVGWCMIQ